MSAPRPTLAKRLFEPIRRIVKRELPRFLADLGTNPAIRSRIILAVDAALVSAFPAARALPSALREKVIGYVLDKVLALIAPGTAPSAFAFTALAPVFDVAELQLTAEETQQLESFAPGNSVRGFLAEGENDDLPAMEKAALDVLGQGWIVEKLAGTERDYWLTHPEAIYSVPEAWQRAHEFEDHPAVATAEPDNEHVAALQQIGGAAAQPMFAAFGGNRKNPKFSCSTETWHAVTTNITKAWAYSTLQGRPAQGEGITIGHLDTGICHHAEVPLDDPRIKVSAGKNLYDPNHPLVGSRPLDPMDGGLDDYVRVGFLLFDGHGTGTISMITGSKKLLGSAPKASVIPFRIYPTVVHFNPRLIAQGIRAATDAGCDVITMSMGGAPSRTRVLEKAVAYAVEKGVIICSAAGNEIGSNDFMPLVVWPAALDEVIAVAGSNCKNRIWNGSSRGREVNITGPAEEVFHAVMDKAVLSPVAPAREVIAHGNGTSFATPQVASIAACWLAHHGKAQLISHYGHVRYLPLAFARLLSTVAYHRPDGWNTDYAGPGIIDAEKLLQAPLPPKNSIQSWPKKPRSPWGRLIGGIFRGWSYLRPAAVPAAAPSFGLFEAEANAGRFEGEIAYHLFDRPALLAALAPLAGAEYSAGEGSTIVAMNSDVETREFEDAERAILSLREIASPALSQVLR